MQLKKIVSAILLLSCSMAYAGEISVAVAGDFFNPLKVLAARFESQTGHKVQLSVGTTGKLYAQIVNGAPFELFLAADQKRPTKLVAQQLASITCASTKRLKRHLGCTV
jgi:molybdate transport system substrate-binding protein